MLRLTLNIISGACRRAHPRPSVAAMGVSVPATMPRAVGGGVVHVDSFSCWGSPDRESERNDLTDMKSTDHHWQFQALLREFYLQRGFLPPPCARRGTVRPRALAGPAG